jgi:phosphatidylserine decarboxylase
VRDDTFMNLMRIVPKAALSTAVGHATRARAPAAVHRMAIKAFARRYGVDLHEAELPLDEYPTFADFFTRRLKPGVRAVDPGQNVVVSPVDGTVSQIGYADRGACIQAKGVRYSLEKLLADPEEARRFLGGAYATLYLSPRDYHRIHAPLSGKITGYSYVPGEFWPVNRASVRLREGLFCSNERLTTYLETGAGRVALVKVGATCVSRIRVTYDDVITHSGGEAKVHRYRVPIPMAKGEELGVFEMGSTVLLLFEDGRARWDAALREESEVRMGQRLGEWQ